MAEIGAGEIEISPMKSLQKGIKRGTENLRKAIAVTGMARQSPLPSEGVAKKQTEIEELSAEARALGGNATDKIPEQLQEKFTETRAGLQSTLQSEKKANGEPTNPERTLDERFERGEMFRIMKRIWAKRSAALPEQKGVWSERMRAVREIAGNLARNLDTLNNQYYSPKSLMMVPVELDGENYEIPIRHYSLGEVTAPQDVPPLIVLGGATSGHRVTKSTAEAFALQYPGRDIYVVSQPNNPDAVIPDNFAEKIKGQEGLDALDVYTRLLKKAIENLGIEQFDLIGISMGGSIGLGAARDELFAKKIRNLMVISPTNIQETKIGMGLMEQFGWEYIRGKLHPKEHLRVGQLQPGQDLKTHKGLGFPSAVNMVREKAFTSEDLAKIRGHVNGRFLVVTGEKDAVISSQKTLQETEDANKKLREEGKKPIESCLVLGGHHNMGDAYAAGLVRLIRETDGSLLPSEYPVSQLENSTAKVLVREDPRLASVADQIIG